MSRLPHLAAAAASLAASLSPHASADIVLADLSQDKIYRCENSGADVRPIIDLDFEFGADAYFPAFTTVVGRDLYVLDWTKKKIYKSNINGDSPVEILDTTTTGFVSQSPTGLASDGALLYFAVGGRLFTCGFDGSSPTEVANLTALMGSIVATSAWDALILGDYYYFTYGEDGVARVKLDGTVGGSIVDMDLVFGSFDYSMRGIATDGLYLYFCAKPGSNPGGVYRCALDGTSPGKIFEWSTNAPLGLTIASSALYLTESGSTGELIRANLDGTGGSVIATIPGANIYDLALASDITEEPIEIKPAIIFRVQTQLGFDYVLQETDDFVTWTDYPVAIIKGDGTERDFCIEDSRASGFFRVISR